MGGNGTSLEGWTKMDTVSPTQDKELNLEYRIDQLRKLRAKIKLMEDKHKELMEPYEATKKALEGALMKWLFDRGLKTAGNSKTVGTITWVDNTTYPIEDKIAFRDFVVENKLWDDMLDWKANKTGVTDYRKENADQLPPGLRENPHPHLRVTPPTGEKKTPTKTKGFELDEAEEE